MPVAKSADEGVRIFVAKEVGGFVEFEDGVPEIIAGHLVARFVEDSLIAGARFLEFALKGARADVEACGVQWHRAGAGDLDEVFVRLRAAGCWAGGAGCGARVGEIVGAASSCAGDCVCCAVGDLLFQCWAVE